MSSICVGECGERCRKMGVKKRLKKGGKAVCHFDDLVLAGGGDFFVGARRTVCETMKPIGIFSRVLHSTSPTVDRTAT